MTKCGCPGDHTAQGYAAFKRQDPNRLSSAVLFLMSTFLVHICITAASLKQVTYVVYNYVCVGHDAKVQLGVCEI